MTSNKWKVIDRDGLKLIAIIAMTMVHIASSFFPNGSARWLIFRIIGRITFPCHGMYVGRRVYLYA